MPSPWAAEPAKKLVDAFLLREPEKVAIARSELQQEVTARYYEAARRRIRVARDLRYSEAVAALVLYREAAVFLIAALGQGSSTEKVEVASGAAEAWKIFDGYPKTLVRRSPPEGLTRARELLSNEALIAPDALGAAELIEATNAVAETVDWLFAAIEPRTPRDIRFTRVVRIVGTALFVLLLIYMLTGSLFSSKNLALNMPVTASSQRPGTGPASGVANGDVERTYGVHTNIEPNPWVRVDLGASVPIHEVRVHNRGDGYESEILPLVLQISDDDNAYTDVEQRTEVFTRDQPWIAKLDRKRARYVRIFMPKQGYIALSEVEVY
jgi:hypothetical protein